MLFGVLIVTHIIIKVKQHSEIGTYGNENHITRRLRSAEPTPQTNKKKKLGTLNGVTSFFALS